jgi:hypothetical protein
MLLIGASLFAPSVAQAADASRVAYAGSMGVGMDFWDLRGLAGATFEPMHSDYHIDRPVRVDPSLEGEGFTVLLGQSGEGKANTFASHRRLPHLGSDWSLMVSITVPAFSNLINLVLLSCVFRRPSECSVTEFADYDVLAITPR